MQLCWSEINKNSTMILEDKYSNGLHDSKHDLYYIILIIIFNVLLIHIITSITFFNQTET
jgi:hypothetical protein